MNLNSILQKHALHHALLVMLLILCGVNVQALESDAAQPIEVVSDDAVRDGQTGVTSYRGNVVVTQGSIKLLADVVNLHTVNGKLNKAIATGNPARLSQKPNPEDPLIKARGSKITYFVGSQSAVLEGNAHLEQDGRELNSDIINYDFKKKYIQAKSNNTKAGDKRVRVVIPPANASANPSPTPAAPAPNVDTNTEAGNNREPQPKPYLPSN